MNKNNYSKFKYGCKYNLKFSYDPKTNNKHILDTELRNIKPELKDEHPGTSIQMNIGQTLIVDNVYSCTQVDYVDQPLIADKKAAKQIFFKLF